MPTPGLKLYFDGGCRPNPGALEIAVVARGVTYREVDIGHGNNTDAEWLALLHAMKIALSLGEADVVLIGDSAVVIHQAKGEWKCRGADLQRHRAAYETLSTGFTRIRLRQVDRSKNLAGIALARHHAGLG